MIILETAATRRAEEAAKKPAREYFKSEMFRALVEAEVSRVDAFKEDVGNTVEPDDFLDDDDAFPGPPARGE